MITKPAALKELAELVQSEFAKMKIAPDTYVFHYNAPVPIVTANGKDYGNALADSGVRFSCLRVWRRRF